MGADPSLPADERLRHAFRTSFGTMLTTSVTTAAAFIITMVIKIPTVRYFALFAALLIAINFLLCITFYFYGLILWDRHLRPAGWCCRVSRQVGAPAVAQEGTGLHRFLRRVAVRGCAQVLAHRRLVLTLAGAATAAFVVLASLLGDPDETEANPYWYSDHPLGRRWQLEVFAFRNSTAGEGIDVQLVLGIETIDRTGTDPTDDNDLGVPVFREAFDLGAAEAQRHVLALCAAVRLSLIHI